MYVDMHVCVLCAFDKKCRRFTSHMHSRCEHVCDHAVFLFSPAVSVTIIWSAATTSSCLGRWPRSGLSSPLGRHTSSASNSSAQLSNRIYAWVYVCAIGAAGGVAPFWATISSYCTHKLQHESQHPMDNVNCIAFGQALGVAVL